jgi:hypothetical protein
MAKNKYKIGCSKDTPQKLDDFEYLMKRLLAITANVINNQPLAHSEIVVVDWNAGCGRYRGPGREVLECTSLITARLAQRCDVPVHLVAVEGDEDFCNSLEIELQQFISPKFHYQILTGDNGDAVDEVEPILDECSEQQRRRLYGVQIFDPNGRPQEPVLRQIQYYSLIRSLDVLANYSTAYIKWFRTVKVTQAGTRQLSEYLYDLHNKQYWSIQKPRGGYRQAAWFLGSDWERLIGRMNPVGMVSIDSKEGQALFDELERTKKERGIPQADSAEREPEREPFYPLFDVYGRT